MDRHQKVGSESVGEDNPYFDRCCLVPAASQDDIDTAGLVLFLDSGGQGEIEISLDEPIGPDRASVDRAAVPEIDHNRHMSDAFAFAHFDGVSTW